MLCLHIVPIDTVHLPCQPYHDDSTVIKWNQRPSQKRLRIVTEHRRNGKQKSSTVSKSRIGCHSDSTVIKWNQEPTRKLLRTVAKHNGKQKSHIGPGFIQHKSKPHWPTLDVLMRNGHWLR